MVFKLMGLKNGKIDNKLKGMRSIKGFKRIKK